MRILGIDEAGRGSIIGPMVICGAMIDDGEMVTLNSLGVKDSKMLKPGERESLDRKIKSLCKTDVRVVNAEEIDMSMSSGINLNQIEAINMAKIINKMSPDRVIIDALNGKRKFLDFMGKFLECKPEIILEHKADQKYPIVSSASIVAKVRRDREMRRIERATGMELGVGYPHDIKSINGLKNNIRNKAFLKYVRHSWSTYSRIREGAEQRKITEY